jgi:TrpR-related protein YerC/YecD
LNTNNWCEKEIRELVKLISEINDVKEVEKLFDLILTPREINDMAKRLKIKKMLEAGSSYLEIERELRVSPVIISRISNSVGYGFRRSYAGVGKKTKSKTKTPKRTIKYKGATPIHKLFT